VSGGVSTRPRHSPGQPVPGLTRWLTIWLFLAAPWLNPYAPGPSSAVIPWLFSAACLGAVLAIQGATAPHPGVAVGLAALAGWALIFSGFAPDAVALAAACLLILLAAALTSCASRRPGFVEAVALAWLLAACASTAIALVQYFGAEEPFAPWINASAVGEAFANLRQRNQFASLTCIGMASILWLSPRVLGRWPASAAMMWLAIGNAATTSRTGLVQILLLGVLACAWPGPRRDRCLLWTGALMAYAAAALALPSVLEWAAGEAGNRLWQRVATLDACSSRLTLWSNVLHLVAQRPWAGWGWGSLDYAHYLTLYPGLRFCDILDNAHNLPLHLAVELGVPVAVAVCLGMSWAVVRAAPWKEGDAARQAAWAVLAVIAVHSLLEYPLWYGPFQIAFGLCLGLLWRSAPQRGTATARRPAADSRMISSAVAALVGGACGFAAWDYHRVSQIYLPPQSRAAAYSADPLATIRRSWLFRHQAEFAELTITPLTRENARWTFETANSMLRYSPEPRVIEKLIESGSLLGRTDELVLHAARFRAAFPQAYARWARSRGPEMNPGVTAP
jgi:O-antigen ligase